MQQLIAAPISLTQAKHAVLSRTHTPLHLHSKSLALASAFFTGIPFRRATCGDSQSLSSAFDAAASPSNSLLVLFVCGHSLDRQRKAYGTPWCACVVDWRLIVWWWWTTRFAVVLLRENYLDKHEKLSACKVVVLKKVQKWRIGKEVFRWKKRKK